MANTTLRPVADLATEPDPGPLTELWYTRCPVPTASGIAYQLGWLTEELGADGLEVGILQDGPRELARHHFDHELVGLFREGGNVPAFAARAEGAPTRLIGLTWIDEWQRILVRPDSGITRPEHLRGARVALPGWASTRAASFPRAMSLHGIKHALQLGGLGLEDVTFVEHPALESGSVRWSDRADGPTWHGLEHLVSGAVDAVYVKGASAAEAARAAGVVVGVDLDAGGDRAARVNNGTPRPLTVHQRILDERPELVVAFLVQTLRAADWAAENLDALRGILQGETQSGLEGVIEAYGDGFHRSLHPTLDGGRLELFARQKDFLLVHGFLAADFDLESWVDHEPLRIAQSIRAAEIAEGRP